MATLIGPTILAGQSLSNSINLGSTKPFLIVTPPEWTPANLTFEVSLDNVSFYALCTFDGGVRHVPCIPNGAFALNTDMWPKDVYIKVRSGTSTNPVVQTANREFKVLVA